MQIPDLSSTSSGSPEFDPLREDVPPSGYPGYARFSLVGEAPGGVEMREKTPFVGSSGMLLTRLLNICGLGRSDCYITNCCKTQLPNNNTNKLYTAKGWKHPSFGELQNRLISELSHVSSPYIILFGETAMRVLLDSPNMDKISKFRGSIYHSEDFPHLAQRLPGKKILVSFHPAAALPNADPMRFYYILNDLYKILKLESDPSLMDLNPILHINPSVEEILEFLHRVSQCSETAFDIECTPKQTTCFSFTVNSNEAMSIPLVNNSGSIFTVESETQIWRAVASILENPNISKIMQNGMFDTMFLLRTLRIKTEGFNFDTMLAQHLCWADLPKGLDFLTSAYTFYPYYKDEGKQHHLKTIKNWDSYWLYNARDALITHCCKAPLEAEISKLNAWDSFYHLMALHKPLMEMEYRGILTNQDPNSGIPAARRMLDRRLSALKKGLYKLSGRDINVNSSPQMKEYFYVTLGLKPYVNRKTKNLSVDDTALKRIARKGKAGSGEAKIIRRIRKTNTLMSKYFSVALDSDNRLRCQYKISGANTGRLASEKTFFGTGTNLQNQPKAFKIYLIPDLGYLLIEIDLSQAEARVVAYVSQDANMIAGFESNIDVHTYNASQIFDIPMSEVTPTQRAMGKRIVHASNYAMGYKTFALDAEIPENRAKDLLNAYHSRFPGLKRWHKEIEKTVTTTRILHNLFNRPKRFLGPINPATLKAAYAYIPQSTVAECLNRGLVSMANDRNLYSVELLATVHDSVLFQVPDYNNPERLSYILSQISSHLETTLYAHGQPFQIPCDAKISRKNWKDMVELKEFSVESVRSAIEEL